MHLLSMVFTSICVKKNLICAFLLANLFIAGCTDIEDVPEDIVSGIDSYFSSNPPDSDYLLYNGSSARGSRIWVEIYMLDEFPFNGQHLANVYCPSQSAAELWNSVEGFTIALSFVSIDNATSKVGLCSAPVT